MRKYVFYTIICEYGKIEVEAESVKEAEKKAYEMDGKYERTQVEIIDCSRKLY